MHRDITLKTGDELTWALERQIMQRTLGRVRRLRVEQREKRVVIRGLATSYFIKQLAIQAALDVLGAAVGTQMELEVQIIVLGPLSAPWPGGDLGTGHVAVSGA